MRGKGFEFGPFHVEDAQAWSAGMLEGVGLEPVSVPPHTIKEIDLRIACRCRMRGSVVMVELRPHSTLALGWSEMTPQSLLTDRDTYDPLRLLHFRLVDPERQLLEVTADHIFRAGSIEITDDDSLQGLKVNVGSYDPWQSSFGCSVLGINSGIINEGKMAVIDLEGGGFRDPETIISPFAALTEASVNGIDVFPQSPQ